MNILMLSTQGDGLGLAQRLRWEGHNVAVWIKEGKSCPKSGLGIVERISSWRTKLRWADLALVDMVGLGSSAQVLSGAQIPFIGAHPLMDKLELERAAGMDLFKRVGIVTPETWSFKSPEEAKSFCSGMKDKLDKGLVIKADGNIGCETTRKITEPEQLDWVFSAYPAGCSMIVQRVVEGVEVSSEGWFNGIEFIRPFNHTFEEKRLMEGNLGPNTGCMGNVVIASESNRLTRATVERLAPFLRRIKWRGPVDVNCIVNEKGAYALEVTARFGYDAIEAFCEGLRTSVGDFFSQIARGEMKEIPITSDWMIAVRLTTLPFPLEVEGVPGKQWGEPILGINEHNIKHLWLFDVMVDEKDLLFKTTAGDGVVLKATARGGSVEFARDRVYRTLDNIRLGDKQYRRDIGKRVNGDMDKLHGWGWL